MLYPFKPEDCWFGLLGSVEGVHERRTSLQLNPFRRRLAGTPGGIGEGRLGVGERAREAERDEAGGDETGCDHLKQRGAGTHSAMRFDGSS